MKRDNNAYRQNYIAERANRIDSCYDGRSHFELWDEENSKRVYCNHKLRYIGTALKDGSVIKDKSGLLGFLRLGGGNIYSNINPSINIAKDKLRRRITTFLGAPSVIAVVWKEAESLRFFDGKSGHGLWGEKDIPKVLWNKIKTVSSLASMYAFGPNCAEVECAVKAYRHEPFNSLKGFRFMAINKRGEFIMPCNGCQKWISALGGKW